MAVMGNDAVARRYVLDVWGRGDFNAEHQLVADDVIDHNQLSGYRQGIEGHHQVLREFHNALSDVELRIDLLVEDGDYVVVRWTMSANHRGEWLGVQPTGRRFTITGIDILRLVNGKIKETWHQEDDLAFMHQIGAVPNAAPMTSPLAIPARPSGR